MSGTGEGHGAKLPRKREQFIAALLSHPTVAAACEACGIRYKSGKKWLSQPDFKEQFRAARREVLDVAVANLQAAAQEAVQTLRRNQTADSPPAVQVRSARSVLELSFRGLEMQDILERLEQLEAAEQARQEVGG